MSIYYVIINEKQNACIARSAIKDHKAFDCISKIKYQYGGYRRSIEHEELLFNTPVEAIGYYKSSLSWLKKYQDTKHTFKKAYIAEYNVGLNDIGKVIEELEYK